MGMLELQGGGRIVLLSRHMIGRSRSMQTTIADAAVSGQHVVISWTGKGWSIRDLGSRNGTFVGEQRLDPGTTQTLTLGDEVVLAAGSWKGRFVADGPPSAVARSGTDWVEGEGDLLALPSMDDPVCLIACGTDGEWRRLDDQTLVGDGETVTVQGSTWTVALPEALAATTEGGSLRRLSDLSLSFRVSQDDEYVEVDATLAGRTTTLKPRAHQYVLLTLARARAEDAANGVAESEQGWVYGEKLEKMVGMRRNQLYVSIHRNRRDLVELGVLDGDDVIERRRTTRQLRVGVSADRLHV
jgi:hypothetical protein